MAEVKEGLMYTETHEWIKVDGKKGTVGLTDFAQNELGDIVFIGFDEIAEEFKKGDDLLPIESHKAMEYIKAPVGGKLLEKNAKLEDNCELVNSDPYGEGWVAIIEISDAAQVSQLMDAAAYSKFLEKTK